MEEASFRNKISGRKRDLRGGRRRDSSIKRRYDVIKRRDDVIKRRDDVMSDDGGIWKGAEIETDSFERVQSVKSKTQSPCKNRLSSTF